MTCKVQAIAQAVHSLERATARLAEAIRNIQVEYSGRSAQVAQRCVAPHGKAWADASLENQAKHLPKLCRDARRPETRREKENVHI